MEVFHTNIGNLSLFLRVASGSGEGCPYLPGSLCTILFYKFLCLLIHYTIIAVIHVSGNFTVKLLQHGISPAAAKGSPYQKITIICTGTQFHIPLTVHNILRNKRHLTSCSHINQNGILQFLYRTQKARLIIPDGNHHRYSLRYAAQ